MKPYYESGGIKIFHGDCRKVLPGIGSVDLIVTDPPYGVNFKSNRASNFDFMQGDESVDVALLGLALALKQLRRGRHVYVFGNFDMKNLPLCEKAELIWDKENFGSGNLELPWGSQHERISFCVYEISKANRKKGYGRLAARMRRGSVLRSLRPNQGDRAKRHPAEKPVDILQMMIESSSLLGETVLDPFTGSGSSLVAAAREGRNAIGIEIEERYCEIAAKRLA